MYHELQALSVIRLRHAVLLSVVVYCVVRSRKLYFVLKNWLTDESSLVARDGALQLSRSVFEGVMNNSLTIELVPDKTPLERYRTRSKGPVTPPPRNEKRETRNEKTIATLKNQQLADFISRNEKT